MPKRTSTSRTTGSTTRSCTRAPKASWTSCKLANEAGADPAITNRTAGSRVIPASERGHVETVRYLLTETDVDVDHVNKLGWTALLEAILLSDGGPRHQEIVALLIDAGADLDLADKDGVKPLAHAGRAVSARSPRLLEAAGATG